MAVFTTDDVSKLGTILAVWAHPDDESFMAGGLLAAAVGNGQKVICITATRGEAGTLDESYRPTKALGDTRSKELKAALDILGVQDHHWLTYTDGTCHQVPDEEAVKTIKQFIERYKPATIITFPPDGLTGHLDHQAVSRWSRLAVQQIDRKIDLYYACDSQEQYNLYTKAMDEKFNIYFNLDKPTLIPETNCDICLKLPKSIINKKVQSLKAMTSQTEAMFKEVGEAGLARALTNETFVLATRIDIAWHPGPFNRRPFKPI